MMKFCVARMGLRMGTAAAMMLLLSAAAWAQTPAPAGDAAAGAKKISMCVGCHGIEGYKTAFPEVYSVPKIGGQQAAYIVKALQAYKSGDRNHPSMKGIAATLSDKDMADLAAYYSTGSSKVAGR
jgi:cytochrome c553